MSFTKKSLLSIVFIMLSINLSYAVSGNNFADPAKACQFQGAVKMDASGNLRYCNGSSWVIPAQKCNAMTSGLLREVAAGVEKCDGTGWVASTALSGSGGTGFTKADGTPWDGKLICATVIAGSSLNKVESCAQIVAGVLQTRIRWYDYWAVPSSTGWVVGLVQYSGSWTASWTAKRVTYTDSSGSPAAFPRSLNIPIL